MGCLAEAPLNSRTAPQFCSPFPNDTFSLEPPGAQPGRVRPGSTIYSGLVVSKLPHYPVPPFPHLPKVGSARSKPSVLPLTQARPTAFRCPPPRPKGTSLPHLRLFQQLRLLVPCTHHSLSHSLAASTRPGPSARSACPLRFNEGT